jgi:hypothetical protein
LILNGSVMVFRARVPAGYGWPDVPDPLLLLLLPSVRSSRPPVLLTLPPSA